MNENNILCSRNCQDFIILYDGLGTYYLYYQNDLIAELINPETPTLIYKNNNLNIPYKTFNKECKNKFLKEIMGLLININGDAPKTQFKLMNILKDLIRTLKDAERDKKVNMEFLSNAPNNIIEKARQLTTLAGYETTIFDDLVNPIDIEEKIKQRQKPILTKEEKAKADAIEKQINKIGLLPYLDNILKDIHIGEHKNIYRKILSEFKIMRGEASFIVETTAKAETGKSFEDDIVYNLITPPRYIFEVNDITLASFVRYALLNPYYFDRVTLLFGDLGAKKSFKKVEDILNIVKPLITEGKYKYTKSNTDNDIDIIEIPLKVNSIGASYQTIFNSFTKDDDQLISRTLFATPGNVDPKDIARQIFYLQNPLTKQSKARAKAEQNLKDFGLYLMKMVNSDIKIINPYLDVFWDYASKSQNPIREFKQQLELFDAYCILTQDKCISEPSSTLFASMEQLKEYMDYINLENALIPYEYDFLQMIMAKGKKHELKILYTNNDLQDADNNLNPNIDLNNVITLTECENYAIELLNNDYAETIADLNPNELKAIPYKLLIGYGLRTTQKDHKEKVFFRYNDIKTYYSKYTAFKNVDNVPGLLQTLYNKGYLGKYEYKQGKQNLYYLTPLCETLTSKFKPKKSYDRYVTDYFANTGYKNF